MPQRRSAVAEPRSRALVDTNVWVSALLNPHGFPAKVLEALKTDQFELVLSEPLLAELLEVLSRPN
jgi:putative PIN family toxin of toxin-antitoxin system